MAAQKQIFQTSSRLRWNTFRWAGRLLFFFVLLTIPIVWVAVARGYKPSLPGLSADNYKMLERPVQPRGFSKQDNKKYHGFHEFLKSHQQNKVVVNKPNLNSSR